MPEALWSVLCVPCALFEAFLASQCWGPGMLKEDPRKFLVIEKVTLSLFQSCVLIIIGLARQGHGHFISFLCRQDGDRNMLCSNGTL